jgi:hypothetical protein
MCRLIAAQPDIFTTTMDAGGRAIAFNVTNGISPGTPEPFGVTTGGNPTVIELWVQASGSRQRTEISVTVGTTVITTDVISVQPNTKMPGFGSRRLRAASVAGRRRRTCRYK